MVKAIVIDGTVGPVREVASGSAMELAEGQTLVTAASLRESHAAFVAEIESEAVDSAGLALMELVEAFPDDPQSAIDAYLAGETVSDAKSKRHDDLAKRLADTEKKLAEANSSPGFVPSDAEPPPEGDDDFANEADEADFKAEWKKDKAVRDEFGTFDTYKAFRRAESVGAFKVLGK